MSDIVKTVKDGISSIAGGIKDLNSAVLDAIQLVWKEVTMPVLEEVFSWFGIEDEYVIEAARISTKIFDDGSDHYQTAVTRAVLQHIQNDATFFQNYTYEVNRTKAQIRSQYRYVGNGNYTYNLPDLTVSAGNIDQGEASTALDASVGGTNIIIDTSSYTPLPLKYFQNDLQQSPELYKPYNNTLTHANQYGEVFDDWELDSVEFNDIDLDYDISISRDAVEAVFWIEGETQVVEGDSITYKIKCNREIPTGSTATISISYSGSAVDGTDYTSVASVDMLQNTQEVDLVITTIENASADSARTMEVVISSIDNSSHMFELVNISATEESIATSITDDDTVILTMSNIRVSEDAVDVTVPVKLEASTSAFTVDFVLTNITATKGTDYENLSGTLSFAGTDGEIQNIVIGITADVVDDDYEQFQVSLTNCSDPGIDISQVAVVTIIDGTDIKYSPGTSTEVLVLSKPDYVAERTLMVKYYSDTGVPEEWSYWFYKYSDGTYPVLEESADRVTGLELLPIIMLRTDKVNVDSDKLSDEYKSAKNLLRFMGIKIDDIVGTLSSNPDIDSVDDACICFGMSPSDNHSAISKMIYQMWDNLIVTYSLQSTVSTYHASYNLDSLLNNSIVWTAHTKTENVFDITPYDVGSYRHEIAGDNLLVYLQTATNEATVIQISNLKSISIVNAVIGGQLYHKSVSNSADDENFIIPVSWFMLNKLNAEELMGAFPLITRLDCYAATLTEIAWYATSGFQIVLRIVQVVITVFFWWAGGGTWAALAYELIVQYAVSELVVLGIEAILEITGNENLALAVGLIAAVLVSGNGSFNIDFMNPSQIVEVSTYFSQNLGVIQNVLQQDFIANQRRVDEEFLEREESIDAANDSLNTAIDGEYQVYLNSMDSNHAMAITMQYNYDYIYNYDSLIKNYHDTKLTIGVI